MSKEKIAITLDEHSSSKNLLRMKRTRLAEESAKLEPALERAMAEEGLAEDMKKRPKS